MSLIWNAYGISEAGIRPLGWGIPEGMEIVVGYGKMKVERGVIDKEGSWR